MNRDEQPTATSAAAGQGERVDASAQGQSAPAASRKQAPVPAWKKGLTPEMVAKQLDFYNTRVLHPAMDLLLEDLMPLLVPHSESNIIVITGATGAGKSTLTTHLLRSLVQDFAGLMGADKSSIPLVAVEAYSNGDTKHGFKGLFQSLAEQLEEPALDGKAPAVIKDGKIRVQPYAKFTIDGLRRVVQDALKARQTRVAVIDEAAHLVRFSKQAVVMDTLKSLSNTAGGVKWVLVGSFDLFDLICEGGQIARRAAILNLERYHIDQPADRKHFQDVVRKLQAKWPCSEIPNFCAISDYLLEASLGCIGLLKSILLDASAMQLRNDGKWAPKFLGKAVKAAKLRSLIQKEIENGEKKVRDALYGNVLWDDATLKKIEHLMEVGHE